MAMTRRQANGAALRRRIRRRARPLAIALWRILLHAHSSVHILQVYLRDSAAAAKTFGGGVPAARSDFLGVPSEQQQATEKVVPSSPKSDGDLSPTLQNLVSGGYQIPAEI